MCLPRACSFALTVFLSLSGSPPLSQVPHSLEGTLICCRQSKLPSVHTQENTNTHTHTTLTYSHLSVSQLVQREYQLQDTAGCLTGCTENLLNTHTHAHTHVCTHIHAHFDVRHLILRVYQSVNINKHNNKVIAVNAMCYILVRFFVCAQVQTDRETESGGEIEQELETVLCPLFIYMRCRIQIVNILNQQRQTVV